MADLKAMHDPSRSRTSWAVSEAKIGTMSQCVGVARHITPSPIEKTVRVVHGIRKFFAPSIFSSHETRPDLIISCGYRPEKLVLKMKRAFHNRPFTVHLQRPEIEGYDLAFVSNHDWSPELDGKNRFERMIGVPHRIDPDDIAKRRPGAKTRLAAEGKKVVAVLVGGANGAYAYDSKFELDIQDAILTLREDGWRVLVSTSRRSAPETFKHLRSLASTDVTVWDQTEPNPYLDYVAAADAFLITKDSVTMPCEALLTGKPVYAFDLTPIPGERFQKFERFHRNLQDELQLTRLFQGQLEGYGYQPLNEARRIADIVRTRMEAQN